MRNSIATQIFTVALGLFFLVLLLQWALISRSFQSLYYDSIVTARRKELSAAVTQYLDGDRPDSSALRQYATRTGSPVFVLTEKHEIADTGLLSWLSTIQVRLPEGMVVNLPVGFLPNLLPNFSSMMTGGMEIGVKLVRLGNTSYYEPLSLTIAGITYTNRSSMREYTANRTDVPQLTGQATVVMTRDLTEASSIQGARALILYDSLKDCLIAGLDVADYVTGLTAASIRVDGQDYGFVADARVIGGVTHYYISVQNIVVTGFEQGYINRYFVGVYAILGAILVVAALYLARRLSRPLRSLSRITEKMAHLDFSQTVHYTGRDELGQLSANINRMSDSLEQALEELKHSNRELERASQLSQANEKRMELILADLAHEFKTPLGLINGFADVLKKGINENPPDYYLDIIMGEVSMMTDLVNEAIELTKLQAGYWSVQLKAHSIRDIAQLVLTRFSKRLEGFELRTDVDDVCVLCDAHRIGQVLTNFISNALKYADSKCIELSSKQEEQGRLTISVGNPGHIPPEKAEKIWSRDYGEGRQMQLRLPSQGVGLDIVKGILEAHGSRFGLTQANGMVWFYFTLEIAEE